MATAALGFFHQLTSINRPVTFPAAVIWHSHTPSSSHVFPFPQSGPANPGGPLILPLARQKKCSPCAGCTGFRFPNPRLLFRRLGLRPAGFNRGNDPGSSRRAHFPLLDRFRGRFRGIVFLPAEFLGGNNSRLALGTHPAWLRPAFPRLGGFGNRFGFGGAILSPAKFLGGPNLGLVSRTHGALSRGGGFYRGGGSYRGGGRLILAEQVTELLFQRRNLFFKIGGFTELM